jgi:hypothetical protein
MSAQPAVPPPECLLSTTRLRERVVPWSRATHDPMGSLLEDAMIYEAGTRAIDFIGDIS